MRFLEKLNNTDIELTALTVWIARKTFALNRVEFYEALGGMIRDGTPSLRALEFLCEIETDFGEKKGTSGMYFLAKECIDSIKASGMLSGALLTWVPPEEATLIRNGEERGNIADALFQVARTVKARREMTSSLIAVCLYPLLLLSLCVVNMYNAHTRIIPIVSAFASEDKWSFQMKLLAGMSEFFIGYGFWLCGTIFALTLLIRFSFSQYTGPGRRMLDKAPPWSLYQTLHGVNYLFSISSMLQINIPLSQALLRMEKGAEKNKWLKERIQAIRKHVLSGQNLATAMRNSGYDFPSRICINKLLLNSEREDSVATMALYADQWLEEAKKRVKRIGLIITGISGGFVFFFILNMISAIYSISDMLKQ
ncbi:type II secretion system F family protein [Escherichia coli]|nr:type II secretion system F family protein [Escherichia coli]